MRYALLLLTAGLLATLLPARLHAHGVPIIISADASLKILTDKQVYSNGALELLGGVLLSAEEPGYSIINSKQGISAGATIKLNVIDQLLWWQSGQVRLDSAQKLNLMNPAGATVGVDKDTAYIPGFTVELYDGLTGWHEHLDYTMQSAAAPTGAYGLLVQIAAAGYQNSDRVLLVFNHGLSAGVYNTAVQALTEAEFKGPGDANGDGFVDFADYTLWADHYLQAKTWRYGNFNYDGIVDSADYTIWADNYNPGGVQGAMAVPEPAACWLLALGGALAAAAGRMGLLKLPGLTPGTRRWR